MKIIASLLVLTVSVLSTAGAGCAHDVRTTYPRASVAGGTLEVALNAPTDQLSIAVNGDLVVDRKHSRKATIELVPAGANVVRVVTSGSCEQGTTVEHVVEIAPGQVTTLALPGPDAGLACAVFNGLYYVGMNLVIAGAIVALAVTGGGGGRK
jgi:hypothetical protein